MGEGSGRAAPASRGGKDIAFAIGIVLILSLFFLPVPAMMIDFGLALSIALSVLILMVALWIQKPLEFSAFPTVLLVATILRLALNISTTRLILSHGEQGPTAAGYIIGGFAHLVMGGDFLTGIIVFLILVTINFLVITKGATRIAEVGARFTLDAIPGKQMAIDADLSAGLIDEKIAQLRRRELEEESAFFGSMDGASKFERGDAIAGIIILAVNIFGGIVIGVTRHALPLASAADTFTKLSVGDGLVTQIPALIISLAAGLLVAKGGTRGSADKAVIDQLSGYPNALFVAAALMAVLGLVPGLPFLPFALLGGLMAFVGIAIPRRIARDRAEETAQQAAKDALAKAETRASIREQLKSFEIELVLSKELNAARISSRDEIASRIAKMRRKFARRYGFVVPEIHLTDDIKARAKTYEIRIHGAPVATHELRVRDWLVIYGDGPRPNLPGDEVREPAFGIRALAIPEAFVKDARREGFKPVDPVSALLTHVSEVIHNNLAQLLSYKDMRAAARPARAGIQAPTRRHVPVADLAVGPAGDAEAAARRARLDPQPQPHPRGGRRDRAACPPPRGHRRACPHPSLPADLRRPGRRRRARRAATRRPLGSRLPPGAQARRQGRGDRIRHRPAADGAVRRRGVDRHPQTHGRAPPVRHRLHRRDAPLRANDHRAYVSDPAHHVATRDRPRLRGQVAGDDLVTAAEALATAPQAFAPKASLGAFLLFCRIGGCLMLAPGFSSSQIPAQIRLFVALAVTLALTPLLLDKIPGAALGGDPILTLKLIAVELLVGGMIGFLARIFFFALETLASAAAQMLGFYNPFGIPIEAGETLAPLATLISLAALTLMFVADLHWELLRGLVASYDVVPVGADFNARLALRQVADALGESFRLTLRISSPYVIYALIVNLALALINRLAPQVQVIFVAAPFVAAGGLALLYFTVKPAIEAFLIGFSAWLSTG